MEERIQYSMIIEWSDEDDAYIVTLPEWGRFAHTHGATYEEAAKNGSEVLEMLMEGPFGEGESLPAPRTFVYGAVVPAASGRT